MFVLELDEISAYPANLYPKLKRFQDNVNVNILGTLYTLEAHPIILSIWRKCSNSAILTLLRGLVNGGRFRSVLDINVYTKILLYTP